MINIVLCGGSGKRLWPLSVSSTPKQFVTFGNEDSLYIDTVKRNRPLCEKTIVVTDQKYSSIADNQLRRAKIDANFILEPSGRNTGASIAVACMEVKEGLVLSTPADHVIEDEAAYADAVTRAKALADDGHIVLFGIEPDRPETRYGYMKVLPDGKVESFHEKPDEVTANSYFEDGSYLFNSGIFCFRAEVMLKELLAHAPDLMITAQCVYDNRRSGKTTHRLCGRFMEKVPVVSIDKAVMEKSDNLVCVKGIKGWKDMGTFDAFYDHRKKNSKGNVELNVGDAVGCIDSYESRNNLVIVEDKDIVLCGVEDLVVVEVKNKLLIARKGSDIEKAIKAIEG